MKRTAAVALLGVVLASTRPASAGVTPQQLAESLQRKYDSVRDFTADFVHTYRGGVLRKQAVERGRVLIKKPGKMRWDYAEPERKQFVSDGVKVYSYLPLDSQVIVSSIAAEDAASTPALFLAGQGHLTRDFWPSLVEAPAGLAAGSLALKLVPKQAQRDYESLILVVDPATLDLRGLMTTDAQGGTSTLAFTHLRQNVGLADKEFTFRIPRGVDVITDGSRS